MKKNMSNIFRLFYNDYKSINYMPSLANVNFGLKEVPFLGHVISVEGIAVDPSKVQEVLKWMEVSEIGNANLLFPQIRGILSLIYSKLLKDRQCNTPGTPGLAVITPDSPLGS
jgi:hypothetical protein